jgi:hypothetical protein
MPSATCSNTSARADGLERNGEWSPGSSMGSVPSPSRSSAAALRCCCVCNRRRSAETEIAATAATPDTPGHPGGRGRAALAYRGIVPSRQRTDRLGSASGPAVDLLAPLDHPGRARARLPGRNHRHERDTQPTPTGLIALTVNEFRRLFDALLLATHHTVATMLAWSRWRRRDQYRARLSHYRRRQHQ